MFWILTDISEPVCLTLNYYVRYLKKIKTTTSKTHMYIVRIAAINDKYKENYVFVFFLLSRLNKYGQLCTLYINNEYEYKHIIL